MPLLPSTARSSTGSSRRPRPSRCSPLLAAAFAWFAVSTILKPGQSTVKVRVGEFVSPSGTMSGADPASLKVRERLLGHVLVSTERAPSGRPGGTASNRSSRSGSSRSGRCPSPPSPWPRASARPLRVLLARARAPGTRPTARRPDRVQAKLQSRRQAFEEQLPDNLTVLAASLRAGHSFVGGLSQVLEEAEEPSQSELRRAVSDEQLGVPVEDALLQSPSGWTTPISSRSPSSPRFSGRRVATRPRCSTSSWRASESGS